MKEVRGGGNEGGFERKKELIFERFITLWQSKVNYLSTPPHFHMYALYMTKFSG